MKKFALTMSTALLVGGLAACNTTDDNAINDRLENNNTRPIGYYTNDDNNDRYGWFGYTNDGTRNADNNDNNRRNSPYTNEGSNSDQFQGPVTDMMDQDDQNHFRNNPQNYNRRGSMQDNENRRDRVGYYDGTDGQLARQIAQRVERLDNVEDARAIVYGNQVVIGVDTSDDNHENVDRQVRRAINDFVQTRNVTVVTDDDMVDRIRSVDTDLEDGGLIEEVQSDINGILNDLGDALQRPFQDNR